MMTQITSLLGLVFGVTGTVLGVLNYLRDRAQVRVTLHWDMSVTPGSKYDSKKKWGIVRVANVGRRPIFVSHVAIRLPKGFNVTHLLLSEGVEGVKLGEGDPEKGFVVSQEGLEQYAACWWKLVAHVSDASGQEWTSKPLPREAMPSWARSVGSSA
jgi:hypothetical protein